MRSSPPIVHLAHASLTCDTEHANRRDRIGRITRRRGGDLERRPRRSLASLIPNSHKRRAVLRTVTRQFRHLTRTALAGFTRLTSTRCLCLRPCRPQRALRASERASAPTRSPPLPHSSSAFLRFSSSPRRTDLPESSCFVA